jgi:hypothetical protein
MTAKAVAKQVKTSGSKKSFRELTSEKKHVMISLLC